MPKLRGNTFSTKSRWWDCDQPVECCRIVSSQIFFIRNHNILLSKLALWFIWSERSAAKEVVRSCLVVCSNWLLLIKITSINWSGSSWLNIDLMYLMDSNYLAKVTPMAEKCLDAIIFYLVPYSIWNSWSLSVWSVCMSVCQSVSPSVPPFSTVYVNIIPLYMLT